MDDDEISGLESWIGAMNKAGHASMFAHPEKSLEPIVERSTAWEWAYAMHEMHGVCIDAITSNDEPNRGFPDCFATVGATAISIELTELVRGNLRNRTCVPFNEAQWTKEQFLEAALQLVLKKEDKAKRWMTPVDVLIIHTDEPWLQPQDLRHWVGNFGKTASDWIGSAFVLQTYVPGWAEGWPLHTLFGVERMLSLSGPR